MKAISSLKRLGAYIKPYKVQFILVLLFTVATVGFNAAMPYVSGLPTTEISRNIAAGEGVPLLDLDRSRWCRLLFLTIDVRAADHQRCPICDARFAARH
mgnify:CR=1 FL=1